MRMFLRPTGAVPLLAAALATILAGCSTGPSNTYQTSSLSPRPEEGMGRGTPRYAEAPRRYVDPGHPTPREFAAASDRYDLEGDRRIQTASIAEPRRTPYYGSEPRWRQPASGITTGSTGYSGASHKPYVVEVREGDTLYSLSRRYNVPVNDLVAANRLPSERIAIGQHLVIPTRYR
jgi:hypothetical protein